MAKRSKNHHRNLRTFTRDGNVGNHCISSKKFINKTHANTLQSLNSKSQNGFSNVPSQNSAAVAANCSRSRQLMSGNLLGFK